MIALLVVTDGRPGYLRRTLESADRFLRGPVTERVMIDDSGDELRRESLRRLYPHFHHLGDGPRKGFGATIAAAWAYLATRHLVQYVFHLEDDFTFDREVDLTGLAEVLDWDPKLHQLALLRQPWNDEERAAGGIIERHPEAYIARRFDQHHWLEHRQCFTTNPSLYRRELTERGWPDGEQSEGVFTHQLLEDPDARFGYWGMRGETPWVEHIGAERAGTGY